MKVLSAYEIKGRGIYLALEAPMHVIKSGDILQVEIAAVEITRGLPYEKQFERPVGLLLGDCKIVSMKVMAQ